MFAQFSFNTNPILSQNKVFTGIKNQKDWQYHITISLILTVCNNILLFSPFKTDFTTMCIYKKSNIGVESEKCIQEKLKGSHLFTIKACKKN